MEKIIFGDNQFFGINHMSEERAQALAEKFRDLKAITDVMKMAWEAGIRGFMLNSNDRAKEICDYLRKNKADFEGLKMYASIPYPHKYANLVAEKGIINAMSDVLCSENTAKERLGLIWKGGSYFSSGGDATKIMELLIDVEMQAFRELNVEVIFLQNVVTDLVLGLGLKEVFIRYYAYIKEKYNAEPGFITMNLPKLVAFLTEVCGLENPIVCSSINKRGYFMNPSVGACEEVISKRKFRSVAMSIYASGAIPSQEAVEYICNQKDIKTIIFGASGKKNIEETVRLIKRYSK